MQKKTFAFAKNIIAYFLQNVNKIKIKNLAKILIFPVPFSQKYDIILPSKREKRGNIKTMQKVVKDVFQDFKKESNIQEAQIQKMN